MISIYKDFHMPSRTIFKFDEELYNKLIPITYTGFPSPAEEFFERRIDLNQILIQNPQSTFFMKVRGNSIENYINDEDILIIDCSLKPSLNDLVIVIEESNFYIRRIVKKNQKTYVASLSKFPVMKTLDNIEIWGVITYVIHSTRK